MELRKLQLTGGSSITVTLPKAWVDKAEVAQGDVVGMVEQSDGSLAIHPHGRGERGVQTYTIDGGDAKPDYLFRKIIAAYLMGYDAIRVNSRHPLTPDARAAVRRAVSRIIGLEVVEEEPNSLTVQDFLDPRQFHVDKALRRMRMLTHAMQNEAIAALKEPSEDLLRSVRDRDDEVDRLYWLVNKQFHAILRDANYAAKMSLTPSQALNFLLVARLVERTADHAARIAEQAAAIERSNDIQALLDKLARQGRKAVELFQEALSTYFKADARAADEVIDRADQLAQGQDRLLREAAALGGEAVSHLAFVIESIGRTAAYAADIGEVAINHKVALG